jgi:hypothetical protein
MEYYCVIDVALKQSSVCVVAGTGSIVREAMVASDPDALIAWFSGLDVTLSRLAWKRGRCRNGCMLVWLEVALSSTCLRHVTCAMPSKRCRSRPTRRTQAALPS